VPSGARIVTSILEAGKVSFSPFIPHVLMLLGLIIPINVSLFRVSVTPLETYGRVELAIYKLVRIHRYTIHTCTCIVFLLLTLRYAIDAICAV
jgi:hypothetical protein